MKLFLDTSVLLAAAGSATGASRAIFVYAASRHWNLCTSRYCVAETVKNILKLPPAAAQVWAPSLHARLDIVTDALVMNKPLSLARGKDKPVLITALAETCDYLLTLDRADFATLLKTNVYGTRVSTPSDFLIHSRATGAL